MSINWIQIVDIKYLKPLKSTGVKPLKISLENAMDICILSILTRLSSLACFDNVAIAETYLVHFLDRQPCDTSWLNWGCHFAEGYSLYFSVDPWA